MSENSGKMGRRDYLKQAGAAVIGLAVGGAAGYYGRGPGEPTGTTVTETLAGTTVTATPAATAAIQPLKVAMLLSGATTDPGWSGAWYQALKALEKKYGASIAVTEHVAFADIERILRDYGSRGYEIVFGAGDQYQDGITQAAPDFPNTIFFSTGTMLEQPPNTGCWHSYEWQIGYAFGALATLMSNSKVIGFIGGVELSSVIAAVNNYVAGAKKYGAKDVLVGYCGTWIDPAKGKEMAEAQIAAGADVIWHTADLSGVGVANAAKEHKVLWMGYPDEAQVDLYPEKFLNSEILDFEMVCDTVYRSHPKNENFFTPAVIQEPLSSKRAFGRGWLRMSPYLGVVPPTDVQSEVNTLVKSISDGLEPTLGFVTKPMY